jgi:hypothetical protein
LIFMAEPSVSTWVFVAENLLRRSSLRMSQSAFNTKNHHLVGIFNLTCGVFQQASKKGETAWVALRDGSRLCITSLNSQFCSGYNGTTSWGKPK